MDNNSEWKKDITKTLKNFAILMVTGVIDTIFLIAWVFSQFVASKVFTILELNNLNRFFYYVFQILFAISTLIPIVLVIYRDVRVMFIRTQREIATEILLGEDHEPN